MPPYNWLLFDADGTLFAYDGAEDQALQNVFAHYKLPFSDITAETYKRINQAIWKRLEEQTVTLLQLRWQRFADLFSKLGISQDAVEFSKTYLHYLGQAADLIPGTLEVLEQLQGKFNLVDRFFPHVFTSEALGVFKPARGFFDAVFEEIGQPSKESVLVIGDSLSSDIAGGVGYGLDTCWYNPNGVENNQGIRATYEIKDLAQLLTVVW